MVAIWTFAKDLWFGRLTRQQASAAIAGIIFITSFLMLLTIDSFGGAAFVSLVGLGLYCAAVNLQWSHIKGFSIFGSSIDFHDVEQLKEEARHLIDSLAQSRIHLFHDALQASFIGNHETDDVYLSSVASRTLSVIHAIEKAGLFEELSYSIMWSTKRAINTTIERMEEKGIRNHEAFRRGYKSNEFRDVCDREIAALRQEDNASSTSLFRLIERLIQLEEYRTKAYELDAEEQQRQAHRGAEDHH